MSYTAPGVTVQELTSPSVNPLISAPTTVCVVGLSSGAVRRTDTVTLVGTTAVALPGLPAGATLSATAIVSVKDSYNVPANVPPAYNTSNGYGSAEYTFSNTAGTIARVSTGGSGTGGASLIPDGETVYVTYDYLPSGYFTATKFTDFASVEATYGAAYDSTGTTINSAVSFGALCAFENGAADVYVAPLFSLTSASDPTSARLQPTTAQVATTAPWQQTLYALRDIADIDIIVPVIGQSFTGVTDAIEVSIFQTVQDHLSYMAGIQKYIMAFFGEDNSTGAMSTPRDTLRSHASTLQARYSGSYNQQMVLVNSTKPVRSAPVNGNTLYVGGQYLAAAIAGSVAGRAVADSITRTVIAGFTGNADTRNRADMDVDGGDGLLVVRVVNGTLQVRHALTLDTTSPDRSEVSVVRSKHNMISAITSTLSSQVTGKSVRDPASFAGAAVQAVLDQLVQHNDLVGYSNIAARQLSGNPTTVEVRFDYKPFFPLNYIGIKFALDTTTQTVTVG